MTTKAETMSIPCAPGTRINLRNSSAKSQKFVIDYGPYGTIVIEGIIGSVVEINVGEIAPTINIVESNSRPGVRLFDE